MKTYKEFLLENTDRDGSVSAIAYDHVLYHGRGHDHWEIVSKLQRHKIANLAQIEDHAEYYYYHEKKNQIKTASSLYARLKPNTEFKKVVNVFDLVNEDYSKLTKETGEDKWVSAFVFNGVVHHGERHGRLDHNELLEPVMDYHRLSHNQLDQYLDSGKIEPVYYNHRLNKYYRQDYDPKNKYTPKKTIEVKGIS